MPLTTPFPIHYILIDVDDELEWHPLPIGVDIRTAVTDYLENDSGIDCSDSSADDAWLVTLDLQDDLPVIAAVESLWLPDFDPDKREADDEGEDA